MPETLDRSQLTKLVQVIEPHLRQADIVRALAYMEQQAHTSDAARLAQEETWQKATAYCDAIGEDKHTAEVAFAKAWEKVFFPELIRQHDSQFEDLRDMYALAVDGVERCPGDVELVRAALLARTRLENAVFDALEKRERAERDNVVTRNVTIATLIGLALMVLFVIAWHNRGKERDAARREANEARKQLDALRQNDAVERSKLAGQLAEAQTAKTNAERAEAQAKADRGEALKKVARLANAAEPQNKLCFASETQHGKKYLLWHKGLRIDVGGCTGDNRLLLIHRFRHTGGPQFELWCGGGAELD